MSATVPEKTRNLIDALQKESRKKVNGYDKMAILVKGLWYNALPKDEEGRIVESGQGTVDLKAARFILEQMHGKPVERRETVVNVFQHYPEHEKLPDLSKYDVEVTPESVV